MSIIYRNILITGPPGSDPYDYAINIGIFVMLTPNYLTTTIYRYRSSYWRMRGGMRFVFGDYEGSSDIDIYEDVCGDIIKKKLEEEDGNIFVHFPKTTAQTEKIVDFVDKALFLVPTEQYCKDFSEKVVLTWGEGLRKAAEDMPEEYIRVNAEAVEVFRKNNKLVVIDSSGPRSEVFNRIVQRLYK